MAEKRFTKFNWLSLLGIAFSLTSSWLGVSSSLVAGLYSGGPVLIIYGLIIGAVFTIMCGLSLCEFSSMLPNASGVCFWVLKLLSEPLDPEVMEKEAIECDNDDLLDITGDGPLADELDEPVLESYCSAENLFITKKWKKDLGIMTGLFNYAGAVFTSASICASLSLSILGVYSLMHPDYELRHWNVFLTYELLNIAMAFVASWARWLPAISQFGLGISVVSYVLTFLISIISRSFNHSEPWPTGKTVFGEFTNTTGWSSSGMAFIVGLINPLWSFAGIDSATHMVDDVGYSASRKLVPRIIIATILLGFVTAFPYAIVMFFCITDSTQVVSSILPILQIYYQATGNKSLSAFMQSCCIITGFICGVSSSTWQNRILWSVSRTYHLIECDEMNTKKAQVVGKIASISSTIRIPVYAHSLSHFFVAVIGCIFMGSSTAFNAIITACISILLLSYAVPCIIMVFVVGKKNFYRNIASEQQALGLSQQVEESRASWYLVPNILTICWALFCLIFLSFPYVIPVDSSNMNYVSVVYGVMAILIAIALY